MSNRKHRPENQKRNNKSRHSLDDKKGDKGKYGKNSGPGEERSKSEVP